MRPLHLLLLGCAFAVLLADRRERRPPPAIADRGFVLLRLDRPAADALRRGAKAADAVAARLSALPGCVARSRLLSPAELDWLLGTALPETGLFWLDPAEIDLADMLRPERIRASVARTARRLAATGTRSGPVLPWDALGLTGPLDGVLRERLGTSLAQPEAPLLEGASANDGVFLAVEIRPDRAPRSAAAARAFRGSVEAGIEAALAEAIPTLAGRGTLRIELGGCLAWPGLAAERDYLLLFALALAGGVVLHAFRRHPRFAGRPASAAALLLPLLIPALLPAAGYDPVAAEALVAVPADSDPVAALLLPAPAKGQARLAALRLVDWQGAEASFRRAAEEAGLEEADFEPCRRLLSAHAARVAAGRLPAPGDYAGTPLAARLVQ